MRIFICFLSFVMLPVSAFALTNVGGDITENTTWGPTGNPPDSVYNLILNVRVLDGIVLTIQPGTRIQAYSDWFFVYGSLIAKGMATEKVIFTSSNANPQPGNWGGFFLDNADSVIIKNCVIKYAGTGISGGNQTLLIDSSEVAQCVFGIAVGNGATISNSLISNNVNCGIEACYISDSLRDNIKNNNIINNNTGLRIDGSMIPDFSIPNIFTNNTNDIHILGNLHITYEDLWQPDIDGADCLVEGILYVDSGGTFHVEPGNTLKFRGDQSSIQLNGGRLIAIGNATRKITFTSANSPPNPGDWNGIEAFCNSSDSNILQHCVVEYGGMVSGFPIRIDSSVIRYCDWGVECDGFVSNSEISNNNTGFIYQGEVLHINNNVIKNNNVAIFVITGSSDRTNIPYFDLPNQFRENQYDIYMGYGLFRIKDSCYWNPTVDSVKVLVNDNIFVDTSGIWSLGPGISFLMNGTGIFARGRILASGTEDRKIIFTSASTNPNPGDWQQIWLYPSSNNCRFTHCTFTYGTPAVINEAPFTIDSSSIRFCTVGLGIMDSGEIRDCDITDNTLYGIGCFGSAANIGIFNNTIMNNPIGINCEAGSIPIIAYNTIADNIDYGVFNVDNNYWIYAENNWWGDSTGPRDTSSIDTLYNPAGMGDRVSDHVDYAPWLNEPPITIAEAELKVAEENNILLSLSPNPFKNDLAINLNLTIDGHVALKIYNIMGQMVCNLIDREYHAGVYKIKWDGSDDSGHLLPAGIYFCQIKTDAFSLVKKIVKLK